MASTTQAINNIAYINSLIVKHKIQKECAENYQRIGEIGTASSICFAFIGLVFGSSALFTLSTLTGAISLSTLIFSNINKHYHENAIKNLENELNCPTIAKVHSEGISGRNSPTTTHIYHHTSPTHIFTETPRVTHVIHHNEPYDSYDYGYHHPTFWNSRPSSTYIPRPQTSMVEKFKPAAQALTEVGGKIFQTMAAPELQGPRAAVGCRS